MDSMTGSESRGEVKSACIACYETKDVDIQLPCGHKYCHDCITEIFDLATKDEDLFPPKCCSQEIELDVVINFLGPELSKRFAEKAIEFRSSNRTYCASSSCSTFIPPNALGEEVAKCPACSQRTCTICKTAAHDGGCPIDTALQQVLQTATENGWQRCFSCNQVIELTHGCNHIVCLCKAEFCYKCGLPWKTCACDQFENPRFQDQEAEMPPRLPWPGADMFEEPGAPGPLQRVYANYPEQPPYEYLFEGLAPAGPFGRLYANIAQPEIGARPRPVEHPPAEEAPMPDVGNLRREIEVLRAVIAQFQEQMLEVVQRVNAVVQALNNRDRLRPNEFPPADEAAQNPAQLAQEGEVPRPVLEEQRIAAEGILEQLLDLGQRMTEALEVFGIVDVLHQNEADPAGEGFMLAAEVTTLEEDMRDLSMVMAALLLRLYPD